MNSNIYFNNSTRKRASNACLGKNAKRPAFIEFILCLIDKILSVKLSFRVKNVLKAAISVSCLVLVTVAIVSVSSGKLDASQGIFTGIFTMIAGIFVLKK